MIVQVAPFTVVMVAVIGGIVGFVLGLQVGSTSKKRAGRK